MAVGSPTTVDSEGCDKKVSYKWSLTSETSQDVKIPRQYPGYATKERPIFVVEVPEDSKVGVRVEVTVQCYKEGEVVGEACTDSIEEVFIKPCFCKITSPEKLPYLELPPRKKVPKAPPLQEDRIFDGHAGLDDWSTPQCRCDATGPHYLIRWKVIGELGKVECQGACEKEGPCVEGELRHFWFADGDASIVDGTDTSYVVVRVGGAWPQSRGEGNYPDPEEVNYCLALTLSRECRCPETEPRTPLPDEPVKLPTTCAWTVYFHCQGLDFKRSDLEGKGSFGPGRPFEKGGAPPG